MAKTNNKDREMNTAKNISTEEIISLYAQHQSSYKVAAIVGCHATAVVKRLKKAGAKMRSTGGIRGGLKYPEDKRAAAQSAGFCSWDVAIAMMSASGQSPRAIAKQLGETTGANVRHRLRYHDEIRTLTRKETACML